MSEKSNEKTPEAGPGCEQRQALLGAYADGELELTASLELEHHLASCPACARTLAAQQALGQAIAAAGLRHLPSDAQRQRLANRLRTHHLPSIPGTRPVAGGQEALGPAALDPAAPRPSGPDSAPSGPPAMAPLGPPAAAPLGPRPVVAAGVPPRPPRALPRSASFLRRPWVSQLAALLLVAVTSWTLGRQWPSRPAGDRLAEEVVASHIRSLLPGERSGVASSDRHTVKPWFNGRLDYAPTVLELASRGFPLLGGRLDYIGNRRVAALTYGAGRHLIDLFTWPDARDGSGSFEGTAQPGGVGGSGALPTAGILGGYHVLRWSRSGMIYFVVSDAAAGSLEDFARALTSELAHSGS